MRRGNVSLFSSRANAAVMTAVAQAAQPAVQQTAPTARSVDPMTLQPRQQAALIFLTESHVKRALVRNLLEDSQDYLSVSDFAPLRDLGFAEWKPGKRLHDLTPAGSAAARELTRGLCVKFDLHDMRGPTGGGYEVHYSCPCGWTAKVRNSHTAHGNASASFNRWHATEAGMQKLVANLQPSRAMEG